MSSRFAIAALAALFAAPAAHAEFKPAQTLVDAAKKEAAVIIYTANQLESEQDLAKQFNARFAGIKIEIVRAPGSRLIARIDAESASNKLGADIIEFSDGGLAVGGYEKLFADYAPANADQYPEALRAVSPKLWPKTSWGHVIVYNTALVKNPPKKWTDLASSSATDSLGWIPGGNGGTAWTLAMFQRQKFGEEYWKAIAAKHPVMYSSDAPLLAAVIRGEVSIAPQKTNTILPSVKDGAPIGFAYGEEGVPVTASAAGISKTAPHPNAARLYLDWILSDEGQAVWVKEDGGLSVLKGAPLPTAGGAEVTTPNLWLPDPKQYASLHDSWVTEWNDIFNYRQ